MVQLKQVKNMCMSPVVKWAGGKRQILEKLKANLPEKFNNYFEPFIGGGALLFDLAPKNATINDVNQELLAIYTCLKDDELYRLMLEELDKHEKIILKNIIIMLENGIEILVLNLSLYGKEQQEQFI